MNSGPPRIVYKTMTAKEFLRQYEHAVRRIARLTEEYEQEQLLIDAVRSLSDNDGMPHGSGVSKPTEDKAVRLADKALRLVDARLDAIDARQKVFDLINDIDGIEGDILFERYINLHKWEEICILVHYSWNGVHQAHRRALRMVQEILDGRV